MSGINKYLGGVSKYFDPSPASAAYAAQTYWEIDPVGGLDSASGAAGQALKTWAEYRNRVGNQPAPAGLVIKLLNSLPASDPLRPPYLGPTSTVTIKADMSSLHTGTITSKTDGAPTSGSGVRTKIVDSALSSGGFASYVGKLVRINGGARDGSTALLAKDTGSKSAEVPYFQQNDLTAIFPYAFGFNLVDPATSDAYEVLDWAVSVAAMEFDQPLSDSPDNITTKLLLQGIDLTRPRLTETTTATGIVSAVNCKLRSPSGRFGAHVCLIDNYQALSGDRPYLSGCLCTTYLFVDSGATVLIDGATSLEACQLEIYGRVFSAQMSSYDAPGNAIEIRPGGVLRSFDLGNGYTEKLYGNGATGGGVHVNSGGLLDYATKPSITGSTPGTNDASVGGTAKAWSGIPFVNTTNGAAIVAHA